MPIQHLNISRSADLSLFDAGYVKPDVCFGWQRDLSVANEKVGDVLKAQGNFRKHWTPISEA
jgi:hypothetical protein